MDHRRQGNVLSVICVWFVQHCKTVQYRAVQFIAIKFIALQCSGGQQKTQVRKTKIPNLAKKKVCPQMIKVSATTN